MNHAQFHRLKTAVQCNAHPGRGLDLELVEAHLRVLLLDSGLFEEVEVEHTDDPDRLVIALCQFRPFYDVDDVAALLEQIWADRVRYPFWEAHSLVTARDHVEFEAATRIGERGHYVTVHLVAQKARIPEQRYGGR
ncbi:MAG: hypothetical protein WB441_00745 [Nocardioidaceae bacterium]